MKRVGIITFLHNDNYGSTLQAWALQKTVTSLGYQAEHLDYNPSRIEKIRNLLVSGNSPRLILEGLRKRAVKAGNAGARSKSAAFAPFYRGQMLLSPACTSHAALRKQAKKYHLLLSGSDQIWSPVWLNPAYFLSFAGRKPRVAYAPSLGVSRMTSKRKARRMAGLIKQYAAVSVREQEGAALLERMLGRPVTVLPDPVFLQPKESWQALAEHPQKEKPCLLCYFIGDSPDYWQHVAELSRQHNLEVKVIPVTENAYHQGYALADGLSPQQWLGWLDSAAYVCTDSFHGAAFSSILEKPFTVLRRYREDDPESKNSRVDNLLRELDLTDEGYDIPWAKVSQRINALRTRGLAWLETALQQALDGPTSAFTAKK